MTPCPAGQHNFVNGQCRRCGLVWASVQAEMTLNTKASATNAARTIIDYIATLPTLPETPAQLVALLLEEFMEAGQEPLGAEFEAVWDENVATLYES